MKIPTYIWVCHKCGKSNNPQTDACSSCGFPANASSYEIEAAINQSELTNFVRYPERNRNIFFIGCNLSLALTYFAFAYNATDEKRIECLAIGALFYGPLLAGSYALATAKNFNLLRISNYLFILMFTLTVFTILVTYIGWNMAGVAIGQLNLLICLVLGINCISLASRHGKT